MYMMRLKLEFCYLKNSHDCLYKLVYTLSNNIMKYNERKECHEENPHCAIKFEAREYENWYR